MPNPLIGTVRLNTSKRGMTDRPQHAETPVIESYVGENNAYRGINDHGVAQQSAPEPAPGYEGMTSGVYEEEEPEKEPIAVRIVSQSARELRRFRTGTEFVDSTTALVARMVIGRNSARVLVKVKNTSANLVYFGETESVTTYTGYPLAAGAEQTFNCEDPVWFVAAAGLSVTLAIYEEFTVTER